MVDTTLSPRLRHLLISEDRSTGRLIMPAGGDLRTSISDGPSPVHLSSSLPNPSISSSSQNTSPAVSPTSLVYDSSPNVTKRPLPIDTASGRLPPPNATNRPMSSIFSLLNGLSVGSPPSSASSSGSIRPQDKDREVKEKGKVSPPYARPQPISPTSESRHLHLQQSQHQYQFHPAPFSAPIIAHRQSMYFDSTHPYKPPFPPPTPSCDDGGMRPGLLRRHSSHPYEYSPAQRPSTAYVTGPIYEVDYAGMGARAPISRTTKACNACRSRKVRCDAGGGDMGACSRCVESGTACIYTGAQKKRGPCPGTARPSISKPRRPSTQSQISSHRSSVASVQSIQSYVLTPTDEQPPWSSRSSYGFPPPPTAFTHPDPSEWSSVAPSKSRPSTAIPATRHSISAPVGDNLRPSSSSVNSWAHNETGPDIGRNMFDRDYVLGPRSNDRNLKMTTTATIDSSDRLGIEPRALPPLRVAINQGSFYES
ncbi:uncharacterized protein IL334_007663 [Kwoniella shivajii]|uniref:Zn(2)-C6 fungal-type domain-containing protein n=1 Tax=Kwoniella shivajii TaxID=564305 RepID=A0ABZ1D9V1_9TREE|nr:hypothetical protein IL334_007663 [Kwoniella shivajii]